VTQAIEFSGRDSRRNVRRDEVENLCGELARDAHFFDFLRRFDDDSHELLRERDG
jgi:hypothetical protein